MQLIDELLRDFDDSSSHSDCLRKVLRSNREALIHKQAAVPFILSRMNLEISNTLLQNNILLTKQQSDKFEQLSSLANIRYGY
ncbi:bacteriocin immunity protein [Lacticaseibacillus rhamnosus]|uniref:bacteriocin immunity protein n=1 Tax=Lacticaseibacillus rhamnosus TaxID=47715 RepID=UPI00254F8E37|nr:bacteriocin immunity protein [Lacticaseibacillus rhamnosus]MDK8383901.1 bacteriocin immunity protein [Lacticaseibacillus rhamnosus]MDK8750141.1 bacteriocin immunity protein [Lacticaseibacillus rhamnosus]